jgi:hypothetical protein
VSPVADQRLAVAAAPGHVERGAGDGQAEDPTPSRIRSAVAATIDGCDQQSCGEAAAIKVNWPAFDLHHLQLRDRRLS